MKKYLIIMFSLLLLMSASSFATDTRVLTMGDNNTILLDDANIWQFPSRINDYPNLAIGEFGQPGDFMDLGIHWQFCEDNPWVLGTYLHNSDTYYPMSSPFRGYYGFPYGYNVDFVPFDWSLLSNQRIDLIYGRQLGLNPFGFRVSLLHSSQRNDIPDDVDEEGFAVYDFAAGLTLGGGLTDVAVGLQLMSWTDKATNPTDSTAYDESKAKGNYLFYAEGRHFWQANPTYTVIPHAAFYYGKNEAEYYQLNAGSDSLAQTDKYDWFGFELGAGLQYAPSNDAMAVIDFGLRYEKLDGEFKNTGGSTRDASSKTLAIPFFKAGADLKVFNWMDVRFGATSYWDRSTLESDFPDKLIQNYADNATYLGFGFHWGNLHVDTYTDPDMFLDGFNFLSGTTNSMNFRISALYEIM